MVSERVPSSFGTVTPRGTLRLRTRTLDLSQPCVMGVLNCTPDSFSDGGQFFDPAMAVAHARQMLDDGAAVIDVGGESTRPGAISVPVQEELRRVIPVIETLAQSSSCIVSIDTTKPEVMRAACAAGAEWINDISALTAPDALLAAVDTGAAVCLMHMQGEPRTMQQSPHYDDVVREVRDYLIQRVETCTAAGIARERLCVDPGFGFGKRLLHNLRLLAQLDAVWQCDVPLMVGLSRKSMLGELTGRQVDDRVAASVAAVALAVVQGASIVRTHDVSATRDALAVAWAVATAAD